MGSDRGAQPLTTYRPTKASSKFSAQCHYKKRAVFREFRGCGGDDVQWYQQHNRVLQGQARLVQQCGGGDDQWDDFQEYKRCAADDDFGYYRWVDSGHVGGKLL